MKAKLSTICLFMFLTAIPVAAKEKLILDAAGAEADALRAARIEIRWVRVVKQRICGQFRVLNCEFLG